MTDGNDGDDTLTGCVFVISGASIFFMLLNYCCLAAATSGRQERENLTLVTGTNDSIYEKEAVCQMHKNNERKKKKERIPCLDCLLLFQCCYFSGLQSTGSRLRVAQRER